MKSFSKTIFPLPFSLVLVFIQPHRNSQSRDQHGHFHPLLVIKKTHAFRCTFTKGASSDVRLWRRKKIQVWVFHVWPCTRHYTQSQHLTIFLQLTHRLAEYWDWSDKTNGKKLCEIIIYNILQKRAQSHRLHWWDFIDDKCLTLFTLKAKIWLRVTIEIIRSNLAARVLIVDTFSARAVIWRASTVTPLQKIPSEM